jgi:hypothetical protein
MPAVGPICDPAAGTFLMLVLCLALLLGALNGNQAQPTFFFG